LISTDPAQRPSRARSRGLVGGAQPIHGWWAPIAQCYIEEVGATARSTRFTAPPQTPPTTLATEGALERREAPPSPPQTSCFITRTRCHQPHLCRFPNSALTEPAPSLPPLRQAEEAPATSTGEMANPSALSPSIVDGLCSSTPLLSCSLSLLEWLFCFCVVECCRSRSSSSLLLIKSCTRLDLLLEIYELIITMVSVAY
jgi:hypothetical protein